MKAHFGTAIWPSLRLAGLVRLAASSGPVSGRSLLLAIGMVLGLGLSSPAQAVDGCKLLLCMAGNWQNITQCTPTVREALRDLARGRAWPTCSMGGNSASGNQHVAPVQCPEQYRTSSTDRRGQLVYSCPFSGVIHVAIEGQPWSRTWWSLSGDSVIEWLPAARAAFASTPDAMDDRFDRDHAAWVISERIRLAAEAEAPGHGGGNGGGG